MEASKQTTYRILVAELKTETASFNPAPTLYEDFRIYRGQDVLNQYRGTRTEMAGALNVFQEHGKVEVVPTIAADAVSGGAIQTECLNRLLDEFVRLVRRGGTVESG